MTYQGICFIIACVCGFVFMIYTFLRPHTRYVLFHNIDMAIPECIEDDDFLFQCLMPYSDENALVSGKELVAFYRLRRTRGRLYFVYERSEWLEIVP